MLESIVLATAQKSLPRIIGRYALFDEVAHGGMATVHIGRLMGPVGFSRTVAIKRMHAQYARDPEFVAMFLDEARLVARIRHPNVVQTLDVVALDKEIFLVMEYVLGASLASIFTAVHRNGEVPNIAVLTTVMASVLHGLHAAHEARSERGTPLEIVHRDVSPQNVLVGVDGVPRVLDFGVAKAAHRVQSTQEGQLKGKLSYMAPEQLHGEKVDRRVDIYAAAIVLWEGLTGRKLFAARSEGLLVAAVLGGATISAQELNGAVPSILNEIVMKGLASRPGDRFATAREFALALEQVGSNLPASVIGEWVERLMGAEIGGRALLLGEVEGISDLMDVPRTMPPAAPSRTPSRLEEVSVLQLDFEPEPEREPEAAASSAHGIKAVHSRASAPTLVLDSARPKYRKSVGLLLGCLLACVLGALAYGRSRLNLSGPQQVAIPQATQATQPAVTILAPPRLEATEAASASSHASAISTPTPIAQTRPLPILKTATLAPSGKPAAQKNDACVPPYIFADGIKQIKPGCDR
jgi:eukaryotic-like serine/threonine-protein kinase